MNISAFSAITQSLHNSQTQVQVIASKPIETPEQIVDSYVSLKSAELQTKVAVKTIQALDENTKTLIDMIA
jgi:CxxC motif-containing protein